MWKQFYIMIDFGFYYKYITDLIKTHFDSGILFIKKNDQFILSLDSVSHIILDPQYLVYLLQISNYAINVSKEYDIIPNLALHEKLLHVINNFYLHKDFSNNKDFVLLPTYFYNINTTTTTTTNNNNDNDNNNATNDMVDEEIVFLKVSKKQWCLHFYNHILNKLNLSSITSFNGKIESDVLLNEIHLIMSLPFVFINNLYIRTISNFFVYLRSSEKNIENGIFNSTDLYDYEITIGNKNIKCVDQIVKNKHMDIGEIFNFFVQKCVQYETNPFVPISYGEDVTNKFWRAEYHGFENDFETFFLTAKPIEEFFKGNSYMYTPRIIKKINKGGEIFSVGFELGFYYLEFFFYFYNFVNETCFLNNINSSSDNFVIKNKLTISLTQDFINKHDIGNRMFRAAMLSGYLIPKFNYFSNSCIFNYRITGKYDTFLSQNYMLSRESIRDIILVPLYGYEYFEKKVFVNQNISASSLHDIVSRNLFFAIYKESTSAKEFGNTTCELLTNIFKHGIDKVKNQININQSGPCKKISLVEYPRITTDDSVRFVFEKGFLEHYNIYFGNVSLFTKLKYLYNIDFASFCIVDTNWLIQNNLLYNIKINILGNFEDFCKFFYVFNEIK